MKRNKLSSQGYFVENLLACRLNDFLRHVTIATRETILLARRKEVCRNRV